MLFSGILFYPRIKIRGYFTGVYFDIRTKVRLELISTFNFQTFNSLKLLNERQAKPDIVVGVVRGVADAIG
jgi:hypothetical protein